MASWDKDLELQKKVVSLENTVNEMQDAVRKLFNELRVAQETATTANNGLVNLREQVRVLNEKSNNNTEALTKRFK